MKTLSWTTRLELALADPQALRVLDKPSIIGLAQHLHPEISEPSVERWIQEAVRAKRLQRVVRGLYLNRLLTPPAQLCEAAVWLRPGAVISLQTALGDSGVWNNYTAWVTVVVPFSSRYTRPSLGRVETAAGTFVFEINLKRPRPVADQRRAGDAAFAILFTERATVTGRRKDV